ncbi:MAG: hypothetical protein ACREMZ_15685 [Gemmatimonadales bacterium]
MTLPFDATKPELRPVSITFFTDEETARRLEELKDTTGIDRSLIVHRILKKAFEEVSIARAKAPK